MFGLIKEYWLDALFIGLPLAGAVACWYYSAPTWLLVFCTVFLTLGVVSLLGDLNVFFAYRDSEDSLSTRVDPDILLVYDRECPLCDTYCRMVRIKDSAGRLRLVDARDQSEVMQEITAEGLDIDQGMVLKIDEQLYYGADAIHALSLISSRSGFFNRMNMRIFRSKHVSRVLYPILRAGRNLLLKILGKSKINNLGLAQNERF